MGDIRESLEEAFGSEDDAAQDDKNQIENIGDQGADDITIDENQDENQDLEVNAENEGAAEGAEPPTSAEADTEQEAASSPNSKDSLKAPVDWAPQEREQWSKVPRELQERILQREKDMAKSMAGTSQAKELGNYMDAVSKEFAPVLQAEGFRHPVEAMQTALQTMGTLRQGTQEQRANVIADLIKNYGVDIETLDRAIVGAGQPNQGGYDPTTAAVEKMLEQRLAPVNQLLQQQQNAQRFQQQQQAEKANSDIQQFAQNNEFLGDVREDMADIIEAGARRGVDITLQQAYDRACAAHPQIAQVMQQRAKEAAILGNNNDIAAKRAAASSVSGRKAGTGSAGNGGGSLRDSIAAAFDEAANS